MTDYLFFDQSKAAFTQITDLFDFVWPTAASMWNLRWQVVGYLGARPSATVEDLEGRFVAGSGIHGANLKRACVDRTWARQQEQFARFLLIDICATYEAWVGGALEALGAASQQNLKELQFPTTSHPTQGKRGVQAAIDRLTVPESAVTTKVIYPGLLRNKKNSLRNLENLMRCYRYFKECRNTLVHTGGASTQETLTAHAAFAAVAQPTLLDMKEAPEHFPPQVGVPVRLSLRGVVGFSGIVLRLIATLDAELSRSKQAEHYLESRWVGILGRQHLLPSRRASRRAKKLRRLVGKLSLPTHRAMAPLEAWALSRRLVN